MDTNGQELALPGFSAFLERDVDRAGAVDLRRKEYNAVRVRKEYPGTFNSVVRALFYYKLPVSMCADLFRMNNATVGGIRDMIVAEAQSSGAASFLVNSRRRSQRDIVLSRLVDIVNEKLENTEIVDSLSITETVDLLKKMEDAPAARNGTDALETAKSGKVLIEEDAEAYDEALADLAEPVNGLNEEKNRALSLADCSGSSGEGSEPRDGAVDCSTPNGICAGGSVVVSNGSQEIKGISPKLCSNLCSRQADGGARVSGGGEAEGVPAAPTPMPAPAPAAPRGGRGAPAPAREGA